MLNLFLSYRRDSSEDICARLRDRIDERFGPGTAFLDTISMPPGARFPDELRRAVGRCHAMVVVVAQDWATVTGPSGGCRLHDPKDFVRQEVELGLQRGVPVIPVLIHGAHMPREDQLPESIRQFTTIQAATLPSDPDGFDDSVNRLLRLLEPLCPPPPVDPPPVNPPPADPPPLPPPPSGRRARLLAGVLFALVVGVGVASGLLPVGEWWSRLANRQPDPTPSGGEPVKIPAEIPVIEPGPYSPVKVGGFTVRLPEMLGRSKPEMPFPLVQAPGAVRGVGWLIVLSRKADLPSGPWFVQDLLAFGSNEPIQFRNWHPAGDTEEVCLLQCDDLAMLRDDEGKSGVIEKPPAGKVAAAVVEGFDADKRSAIHRLRVAGR